MSVIRSILILLLALGGTSLVHGQFQLKGGSFNTLHGPPGAPVDPDGTPPVITPQFAGMAVTSATSGPIDASGSPAPSELYNQYPSDQEDDGSGVVVAVILQRSSFGGAFASGVPRYFFGDEILPPETDAAGQPLVGPARDYWRSRPVTYGEVIAQPGGGSVTPLLNPNAPAPAPAHSYYHSPHANRVFAHQSGQVKIKWVTKVPVDINGNPDPAGEFRFLDEVFNVGSGSNRPVRKIYWTERSFNGPLINVPEGRIVTVNPVYNAFMTESVEEEYEQIGGAEPEGPPVLRTFWWDNENGTRQLRAYNLEGRILVEYLGELREGSVHEFLGADVVEVDQVARSVTATVKLGEEILPHNTATTVAPDADELLASEIRGLQQGNITYFGTSVREDDTRAYHAEWENKNPDRVAFYWLETQDASIHFLDEPDAPGLEIAWPKYLNRYLQVWPDSLSEYEGVSVTDTGNTVDTGVQFDGGTLPDLVHQDDPAQAEASIDQGTQRLEVDFSPTGDRTNRSLLKFQTGSEVWYVRLFIQSETVLGSPLIPEVPDPDGPGPLVGTPEIPAVYALADLDADGVRDLVDGSIKVGQRIEAPPGFEVAGYISGGTGYHPGAYLDPFQAGIEDAATGAIIPVNADPADDTLTVWWFKKVEYEGDGIPPFYVPAKSGKYTVSYPAGSPQIVLASNDGSGEFPNTPLGAAQAAGEIYVQNDSSQPGYNPNEEHALMLSGRVYALRDDLNMTAGYTSEPFVLLSYTDPDDGRPAMQLFEVEREVDLAGTENDILFDYPVTAGATVPSPMPLPLMAVPIGADGLSKNREVDGIPDPAPDRTGPVALYDRFTFQDRKGYTKVYRGPHDGGSPTMGMEFFYLMQPGFFVPGMSPQPDEGEILPYLRADDSAPLVLSDQPLTITYRPQWPDIVPQLLVGETLALPKFGLPQVRGQASAEVLYQQSIAIGGPTATSVTLHDPTRAKTVLLSTQFSPGQEAERELMLDGIATTIYNSRTYFQGLPPHLQERFYMNPILGGDLQLILEGEFVDEIAGEDYFNLNVLSEGDVAALKGIVAEEGTGKSEWDALIEGLTTNVETFGESETKKGTYEVKTSDSVGGADLAEISDSDTAVDSYALSATGQGSGYVSLLFGDGEAFTPEGDPVSIAVIRVPEKLYEGDMKVQFSSNPLDEKVGLRHSGDFAGAPENYEFEWRYHTGSEIKPVYDKGTPVTVLGNSTFWDIAQNPVGLLPTNAEYDDGTQSGDVTLQIYDENFQPGAHPGVVLKSQTAVNLNDGLGNSIPGDVVFSAELSNDFDGFVVYVNGVEALAFRAPEPFENTAATGGLAAGGLARQFRIDKNYFSGGDTVEVALYSQADPLVTSTVEFCLQVIPWSDLVTDNSAWQKPSGELLNQITIGGSPTAPLGDPVLLVSDNTFTMRYRPLIDKGHILAPGAVQDEVPWSDWMEPKLVPGWVKRVLDAINPYNQRLTDLFTNAVDTNVSVLTQAGTRWEGDIALTLDNLDDVGLIEIYETVLNRAKLFTIDNGYDYGPANDALLLAAGYLNDLYLLLGNEAFADAANPTISLDDQDTITEVNTSRFSFEGQASSVLEEELALLRGRDDSLSTSTAIAPAYNRLYWNYTNGIDSGEVIYALNYNIKEKVGSATQDGVIDAADAQRMFPQGHGDAYGHYLTALKGYYKLLTNPNFSWVPRAETVLVLGQNVAVDYLDERKFASAAANVARTAEQVLGLTHRLAYKDDTAGGWSHLRDDSGANWGVDGWASRASQGAYVNWVVGNALLPDVDPDPEHQGIEIVDRTTVPELAELAVLGGALQTRVDNANAHLNPLGLSPDAIAFDISPAALKAGESHYEQINGRALAAVLNAKGAFDQAARMTRLLRNQVNQIDDYNTVIEDQERAFRYKLQDIFGTPYTGDIGPGKTYAQGYEGPDLFNWFLVDEAVEGGLLSGVVKEKVNIFRPVGAPPELGEMSVEDIAAAAIFGRDDDEDRVDVLNLEAFEIDVEPNRLATEATGVLGLDAGERRITGELQVAMLEAREKQTRLIEGADEVKDLTDRVWARFKLYQQLVLTQEAQLQTRERTAEEIYAATKLQKALESTSRALELAAFTAYDAGEAAAEALPGLVGVSNDATSAGRAAFLIAGTAISALARVESVAVDVAARQVEAANVERTLLLPAELDALGFSYEEKQFIYEFNILYERLIDQSFEVAARAEQYQRATEKVRNVLARGDRLLAEREIFRLRAAALVQGYRTRDVAFRTFRNEALEQYRTLFDLGARYTYLAAKSYDYETGLLGSAAGQEVINRIVASRSLGDLTGGVPQATTSTLGDAGLAGTMAQLNADFAVAEGRLGINNPDQNGTLFSLRHELFRLLDDPNQTADDDAWRQTLEQFIVSDLRSDPDVLANCRNLSKPDGSPVPGIIIPFGSTIRHGYNWFGLPLAGGDHQYSPSNYATKIYSAGMVMEGYVGMDPYAFGTPQAGEPVTGAGDSLSATPYVYLIPAGTDHMLAPPLGDTGAVRSWSVADQALPLPYNLGASDFNSGQFFEANGTLSEEPWVQRKHQAFRPVDDPAFFYSLIPQEFVSNRLVGRSVWNSEWKIVIPAYTLLNDDEEGLERFVRSVDDIKIFLRTYSNSGN